MQRRRLISAFTQATNPPRPTRRWGARAAGRAPTQPTTRAPRTRAAAPPATRALERPRRRRHHLGAAAPAAAATTACVLAAAACGRGAAGQRPPATPRAPFRRHPARPAGCRRPRQARVSLAIEFMVSWRPRATASDGAGAGGCGAVLVLGEAGSNGGAAGSAAPPNAHEQSGAAARGPPPADKHVSSAPRLDSNQMWWAVTNMKHMPEPENRL